jgi:hypothetical protein
MHILKMVKTVALAAVVLLSFALLWTFVSLARLPRDTAIGISALYSPAFLDLGGPRDRCGCWALP